MNEMRSLHVENSNLESRKHRVVPNNVELGIIPPCLASLHSVSRSSNCPISHKSGEDKPYSRLADQSNVILLTGPNMGGKSTLLRQVCLAVIMAQLGCWVFASNCALSSVDRIFTRIGACDDFLHGASTFLVELEDTVQVFKLATRHSLVILDELGRGTSTYDGYAIAYATLLHLVQHIQCRVIFSTHYYNLCQDVNMQTNLVQDVKMQHMAALVQGSLDTINQDIVLNHMQVNDVEHNLPNGIESMTISTELLDKRNEPTPNEVTCSIPYSFTVPQFPKTDNTNVILPSAFEQPMISEQTFSHNESSSLREEIQSVSNPITFLYKMLPGICPKSYGMLIARMAGIPECVVRHAEQDALILQQRYLISLPTFRKQLSMTRSIVLERVKLLACLIKFLNQRVHTSKTSKTKGKDHDEKLDAAR